MSKSEVKERDYLRIYLLYNEINDSFGEISSQIAEMYKKDRTCQVAGCSKSTLYRALNMGRHLMKDFCRII
jgi:hypothetical protein